MLGCEKTNTIVYCDARYIYMIIQKSFVPYTTMSEIFAINTGPLKTVGELYIGPTGSEISSRRWTLLNLELFMHGRGPCSAGNHAYSLKIIYKGQL